MEKAYNLHEFGENRRGFVVEANIRTKDNRREQTGILLDSGSNIHVVDKKWGDEIGLKQVGVLATYLKTAVGTTDINPNILSQ